MARAIYAFFFRIFGWSTSGKVPKGLKKFVIIVAPHTSNWDFMVGLCARSILGLQNTKYIAKKELFVWPVGWLFRLLGGYPVDRSKNTNLVDATVDIFNSKDSFSIAITPEGTRSHVSKWKTGFYYIAQKAGIPIIMVAFDYAARQVRVEPPFYPTGDVDKDISYMMDYYRKVKGKNPAQGVT
jgi:1-acyl-sn-glycerol-3-phosphate acyltransferase